MKKMTKREKVILGVSIGLGVVVVGTTGYFGVKCYSLNRENNLLQKTNNVLNDKVTKAQSFYAIADTIEEEL